MSCHQLAHNQTDSITEPGHFHKRLKGGSRRKTFPFRGRKNFSWTKGLGTVIKSRNRFRCGWNWTEREWWNTKGLNDFKISQKYCTTSIKFQNRFQTRVLAFVVIPRNAQEQEISLMSVWGTEHSGWDLNLIAECNLADRSETATNLFIGQFSWNQNSEYLFAWKQTQLASVA